MTAPAPEKAAPIPAEVLALARLASIEIGEWVVDRSRKHPRDIVADLLRADRASQEERIRENEQALDVEQALRRLLYWFGRYPEYKPAPDCLETVAKDIEKARATILASDRARLRGGAS